MRHAPVTVAHVGGQVEPQLRAERGKARGALLGCGEEQHRAWRAVACRAPREVKEVVGGGRHPHHHHQVDSMHIQPPRRARRRHQHARAPNCRC